MGIRLCLYPFHADISISNRDIWIYLHLFPIKYRYRIYLQLFPIKYRYLYSNIDIAIKIKLRYLYFKYRFHHLNKRYLYLN